MCPSKQPAPPVNPAPYSLDQSHTAVTATATPDSTTMDEDSALAAKPSQAKDNAGPKVTGGAGVNADLLSM